MDHWPVKSGIFMGAQLVDDGLDAQHEQLVTKM